MRRVIVVPHDPNWTKTFTDASAEVASVMGGNLLEIHHIGSTSISGIPAKPIIDMLAVVADIPELDLRRGQMELLGYEAMGEFGISGRRYFRRNDAKDVRTHQVHAFQTGSSHIQRHLVFRDFMRAHPALAREYGELKQRLATLYPADMNAYMDGKDAFIKEMEARALDWVR
jgi:GrpB-like predicted nucleotidyltransferase (UPF0157 family)